MTPTELAAAIMGIGAALVVVGGFVGCGLMALQYGRDVDAMRSAYRADLALLARRVADHAQYDLGTDRERVTGDLLRDLYGRISHIDGGSHGRG